MTIEAQRLPINGKSAIGTCCRNSAKMLEIADEDHPALQKHNQGQAGLLRRAADMADEQEALVTDLLAALQALTIACEHEANTGMFPTDWGVRVRQARAAIAKAEGAL